MRANRSGACSSERFYFGEHTMDKNGRPREARDVLTVRDVQQILPGLVMRPMSKAQAHDDGRPKQSTAAGAESIAREARSIRYDDLPEVLTPKEVQAFLRLGRNAIYAALQEGRIRSVRHGQKFLVPKTALREFLDHDAEHRHAGIPVKGTT
jgi:excisionase family DNA binding protein